jgi:ribosomal protein S7
MAKKYIVNIKKQKLKLKKNIIYNSTWFTKLLNWLQVSGKKFNVEKNMYLSLNRLKKDHNLLAIYIFFETIEIIRPGFQIISIKKGAQTYKVPIPLKGYKQYNTAIKWLARLINVKSKRSLEESYFSEFLNILNEESLLFKNSEDFKNTLLFNRTYLHFRW